MIFQQNKWEEFYDSMPYIYDFIAYHCTKLFLLCRVGRKELISTKVFKLSVKFQILNNKMLAKFIKFN